MALSGAHCHTPPTPPSPYWVFHSDRTELEEALVVRSQKALAALQSGATVRWQDPLALHGLIAGVESSTIVTPRARDAARFALNNWAGIDAYVRSLVTATERFETIAAMVRISRLYALSEQLNTAADAGAAATHTSGRFDAYWAAWPGISQLALESDWVPLSPPAAVLHLAGSDCGQAPPADGSMPPLAADRGANTVLDEWNTHIGITTIRRLQQWVPPLPLSGAAALLAADHMSHMMWHAAYRGDVPHFTTANSNPGDLKILADAYLARVRASLEAVVLHGDAGTPYRDLNGGPQPAFAVAAEERAFTSEIRFRLNTLASIGSIEFVSPTTPRINSEGEFAFVPNVTYREEGIADPLYVNGGLWPGLRPNYQAPSPAPGGWIVLNPTTVDFLDLEFKIWRTARPLDHIDFQLRRPDGTPVYATYRHLPQVDGTIALGHRFDFSALAPSATASAQYDEFSIHAVPMDQANHPSLGACRNLNIKWVSAEPSAYETLLMDPLPGLSRDYICDDYSSSGSFSDAFTDAPERTIFISDNGYGLSARPDTLFITTSGETIRITNMDGAAHRFRTTSTRVLRTLGSTGGIERDLDTGALAPGGSVVLTLPTGLPSPYWFNFVDEASDMSFTAFYRNTSCD